MSEVESISHSGMTAPDTWEAQRFYEEVLGGAALETVTRSYRGDRGGEAHPCSTIGDYLFVSFPRLRDLAPPEQLRGGYENCRHGFAVARERFDEALRELEAHGVSYEGPVTHPEAGPIGQSIYFRDPGGNFFELCWRRDEDVAYNPVLMGTD